MKLNKTIAGLALVAGTTLAPTAARASDSQAVQMQNAETPQEAAQIKADLLKEALSRRAPHDELVQHISFPKVCLSMNMGNLM